MSLYVEIMCDIRKEGHAPESVLLHRCWSDRNDNPQGHTVPQAKAEARQQGWKIGPGGAAICPGCRDPSPVQRIYE